MKRIFNHHYEYSPSRNCMKLVGKNIYVSYDETIEQWVATYPRWCWGLWSMSESAKSADKAVDKLLASEDYRRRNRRKKGKEVARAK